MRRVSLSSPRSTTSGQEFGERPREALLVDIRQLPYVPCQSGRGCRVLDTRIAVVLEGEQDRLVKGHRLLAVTPHWSLDPGCLHVVLALDDSGCERPLL